MSLYMNFSYLNPMVVVFLTDDIDDLGNVNKSAKTSILMKFLQIRVFQHIPHSNFHLFLLLLLLLFNRVLW